MLVAWPGLVADFFEREAKARAMTGGWEETRVAVSGGEVAVRWRGSGDPTLFVHGAGGDGHNWDGVVERLEGRLRCVEVDRCGYGDSTWIEPFPPTRYDHGSHLHRVVDALSLDRPFAVGTSAGALAILAALTSTPDLFRAAVLMEPPLRISSTAPSGEALPLVSQRQPETKSDLVAQGEASIRRTDSAAWEALSGPDRQRYIASFPTMLRDTSQPSFVLTTSQARTLMLPVKVMYGSVSSERFTESSKDLASSLPRGVLEQVDGAAHLMYVTHENEVAEAIWSFVQQHSVNQIEHMTSEESGAAALDSQGEEG